MKSTFLLLMLALLVVGGCHRDPYYLRYQDPVTQLYGFKDEKGKVVVPAQYKMIFGGDEFSGNRKFFHSSERNTEYLVAVLKDGKFRRISKDGRLGFKSVLSDNWPDDYVEGLARFIERAADGKYKVGLHDRKGNVVIAPRYSCASRFYNGFSVVCKECWAEEKGPVKYFPLSNRLDGELFRLDTKEEHRPYADLKGGTWGAIDITGKERVPCIYKTYDEVVNILKKKNSYGLRLS